MKKIFLLLASLFINTASFAQYPSFVWARMATSIGADELAEVALDHSGFVYAVGKFDEDIIIGTDTFAIPSSGNSDALFVKYDTSGNYIWGQQLGGSGPQDASSIVISSSDDIYISGKIIGNAYMGTTAGGIATYLNSAGSQRGYLSKFNTNGELVWTRLIDGTFSTEVQSLALDNNGDVLLTGTFFATANFGNGVTITSAHQLDLYVAKFDQNGTCSWAFAEGGRNADWSYDIAVDANNNFAIAGSFDDTLNLSGNILVARGLGDAIVAYYNASGVLQWYDQAGGYSTQTVTADAAYSLSFDSNNNLWVTGYYQDSILFGTNTLHSLGYSDVFIVQYASYGTVLQSSSFGGSGLHDRPSAIELDVLDNVYVSASPYYNFSVGDSTYYTFGITDAAVLKFNSALDMQWMKKAGSPYSDFAGGIAINDIGEVYVVGSMGDKSPVIFDTISITPTGTEQWYEAFIAKLSWMEPVVTGIDQYVFDNGIFVYPNPANEELYISLNDSREILITDITGKKVFSEKIASSKMISTASFAPGMYIIHLDDSARKIKFIVTH